MSRRIAMMSVLGLLAAGLGCKHVAGKCDCGAHPADAVMSGPSTPYPTGPVPGVTAPPAIPPAGTNGGPGKIVVPDSLPK